MTTDTARANGEAVPAVSDLLRRAIERHAAAQVYFSASAYLSDRGVLGREPTEMEMAEYQAASDAEAEALSTVCYFPARSPADLAAKARHLRKHHSDRFGSLEPWQVENLLRSMLPDEERDALPEGGAA